MKYVVNIGVGGYSLPEEYCDLPDRYYLNEDIRIDPRLIEIVEGPDYEGELAIVTIPDSATDTYICEMDDSGEETLLYVVDGKIYEAT